MDNIGDTPQKSNGSTMDSTMDSKTKITNRYY